MQFLIDQTKTDPTQNETPASDGFFNFLNCPHAAWTSTIDISWFWAIFPNGQSTFVEAHKGDVNMRLPWRQVGDMFYPGEQYFWYQ